MVQVPMHRGAQLHKEDQSGVTWLLENPVPVLLMAQVLVAERETIQKAKSQALYHICRTRSGNKEEKATRNGGQRHWRSRGP